MQMGEIRGRRTQVLARLSLSVFLFARATHRGKRERVLRCQK